MIGRLTDSEIENLLQGRLIGRIGCADDQRVYIVPINYIYEEGNILCRSNEGLKIEMMRERPSVCFQVDEIRDQQNWQSVVIWGTYEELEDGPEKYEVMQKFVDKMLRLKISETAIPPELTTDRTHPRSPGNIKPVFFRVKIQEISGRFERSGD